MPSFNRISKTFACDRMLNSETIRGALANSYLRYLGEEKQKPYDVLIKIAKTNGIAVPDAREVIATLEAGGAIASYSHKRDDGRYSVFVKLTAIGEKLNSGAQ